MNISEHKRLVAAIPEDLRAGEEIEVSNSGDFWDKQKFRHIGFNESDGFWIYTEHGSWNYARRPAAAQKTHECTSFTPYGNEGYCMCGTHRSRHAASQKKLEDVKCCDTCQHRDNVQCFYCENMDKWQNSLERRPE